jgi:indolepyruvate ferredoxin oxidoreductase
MERQLIGDYEQLVADILPGLSAQKLQTAVELANLPDGIRGFGHVKEKAVGEVETRKNELLAAFADRGSFREIR